EDFNPFRGNQYQNKRLADPSKGLYAKDKYGKPIFDPAKAGKKMTYAELLASQGQTAQTNGQTANGQTANGQTANGQTANGQTANGQANPAATVAQTPKNSGKPYNPDFR